MLTVTLSDEDLKIIQNYLFKNGYDYLNKEIKRIDRISHSLANEYVKELHKCKDQMKQLEAKFVVDAGEIKK